MHFVVGLVAAVILQWIVVVVLTMTAFVNDIVVTSTIAVPLFRDVVVLGDIVWIVSIVTMDWKLL